MSRECLERAPTVSRRLRIHHLEQGGSVFRKALVAVGTLALISAPFAGVGSTQSAASSNFAGPFFGPQPKGAANSIEVQICDLIAVATKTVDIANFTWSSQPIVTALITAHTSGITVRVVADSSDTASAPYTSQLTTAGITVVQRAGGISGIMHCKYLVIDQTYVWMGSANMTT